MKANGKEMLAADVAWNDTLTATDMKESFSLASLMEKVCTLGQMERSMKENGLAG